MSQNYLFAPTEDTWKGVTYGGVSIPRAGTLLAVVTDDEWVYPASDKVADFVSDCLYFTSGKADSMPDHVLHVQAVPVDKFIRLVTKTLEDPR